MVEMPKLIAEARRYGVLELAADGLIHIEGRFPEPLLAVLQAYKEEIRSTLRQERAILPEPSEVVDAVERELARLEALGQALGRGEITAIRCGITGKKCTLCKGVPCWGSTPWHE